MQLFSKGLLMAGLMALPMTASADFLIQSFETADLTQPNNISVNGGNVASSGFSTTGVTDGASSYEVTPNASGATFLLRIDALNNPGLIAALRANPVVAFDITAPTDPNPNNGENGFGTVRIVNSLAGGFDASSPGAYYDTYVAYGAGPIASSFTLTTAQIDALEDPTNTYAEITLGINGQGGEIPTVFYDNIRVLAVPEPASLMLLGLGSLAMLGRRR